VGLTVFFSYQAIIWFKLTLDSHPSGAAKSVQKLSLPHIKNFACGFGGLIYGKMWAGDDIDAGQWAGQWIEEFFLAHCVFGTYGCHSVGKTEV